MLWTIAVILLVVWALGLVTSYTAGGFVHAQALLRVRAGDFEGAGRADPGAAQG